MENSPPIIGITGGIGAGKTTICKIFEILGAKIYYADDRAKWLMNHDSELIRKIKHLFGEKSYKKEQLDNGFIANQAFNDHSLLKKLNEVVHPKVNADSKKWIEEKQGEKLLLKESALLFESLSSQQLDKNILVIAPKEIRIKRVMKRDPHRNEAAVKAIIAQQMSDEKKIPLADFIIENNEKKSLLQQVMAIHSLI